MLLYIFATPSSHLFFFFFFFCSIFFTWFISLRNIFLDRNANSPIFLQCVFQVEIVDNMAFVSFVHDVVSVSFACQYHSQRSQWPIMAFSFLFFFPFIFFSHLYFFLPSSSFFFFFFFLSPRLNSTLIAKVCTDPRLSSGGIEFCLAAKFPTRSPLISDRKLNGY